MKKFGRWTVSSSATPWSASARSDRCGRSWSLKSLSKEFRNPPVTSPAWPCAFHGSPAGAATKRLKRPIPLKRSNHCCQHHDILRRDRWLADRWSFRRTIGEHEGFKRVTGCKHVSEYDEIEGCRKKRSPDRYT